jgi:NADH-quinone oxidoreductase subunit N
VFGLLTGVVAAFYYLRLVKTIWFDAAPGETDARRWTPGSPSPRPVRLPGRLPALGVLEPYAARAARSFGLS